MSQGFKIREYDNTNIFSLENDCCGVLFKLKNLHFTGVFVLILMRVTRQVKVGKKKKNWLATDSHVYQQQEQGFLNICLFTESDVNKLVKL